MTISLKTLADKCIWALTTFLLMLFVVFSSATWGRYAFFGASVLVILLSAVYNRMILRIRIQPYYVFFLAFALYTLLTAAWATEPSDAVIKASTLMQILACAAMVYIHYDRTGDMTGLLRAFMWSGYLVSVYTLVFYGVDRIAAEVGDYRFGSDFANANTMGMVAALSCVLQVSELMNKRSPWTAIFLIPALIVVAAVQSRKALLMLAGGVLGVVLLRGDRQGKFANKLAKWFLFLGIALAGLWLLAQLPMFAGVMERMQGMLAYWTGEGKADHSTIVRNQMIELGIDLFRQKPLLGVGIGCTHIYSNQQLGLDTYLHNNYVELLSGGGLVGFCLYYCIYVYLGIALFRYRKADPEAFSVGLMWLGLMLVMDYGMVSYYGKLQWYYLLFHFLNVSNLKKKHREMQGNAEEAAAKRN